MPSPDGAADLRLQGVVAVPAAPPDGTAGGEHARAVGQTARAPEASMRRVGFTVEWRAR